MTNLLVTACLRNLVASVRVALLLVALVVLGTIHVCDVATAFLRRSVGRRVVVVPAAARSVGLSLDELRKLPCYEFDDFQAGGAARRESSADDCALCSESFGAGDRCRLLPVCGHSFHAKCVDPWLLVVPVCPICRTSAASTTTMATMVIGLLSS